MPSDQEQSPSTRSPPIISASSRPLALSPQLQYNITSNSNDPEHPVRSRASSDIIQESASPASPSLGPMSAPSIPPPRVFSSPDTGNFVSLPTRGPLNQNITMGPQRQTSASSEVSFTSSRSLASLKIPSTPLLLSTRLPNLSLDAQPRPFTEDNSQASHTAPSDQLGYKPRVRKVHTKEIAPDDIQAVVALGMAPFMIGKDAMYNQNRLVRNEAILTQHVLRLQRSQFQSESVHAKREEDIYRILQEHTAAINNIAVPVKSMDAGASAGGAHGPSSISLRTDPDFSALLEVQVDMRNRLDRLMADVAATTLSTKLTLEHLDERIRHLATTVPTSVPPTPTPTPTPSTAHDMLLPRLTQMARSGASPERADRKRKRDEWMANVTPPRPGSGYEHRPSARHYYSRGQRTERPEDDISMNHFYDPMSSPHRGGSSSNYYADDDDDRYHWSPSRIRMVANEAVRDADLSPRVLHSARRAHDAPADRHARLPEPPWMRSTESGLEGRMASSSNSNAK